MTTRYHLLAKVTVLAIALASPTIEAFAQGREPLKRPASVPTDLATALASAALFSEGDPQILVGALPEWVASRVYIPAGSRVLGSAFIGSTVLGVVTVPSSSDTLMKQFERGLQQLGWTQLPAMAPRGGGFRPAPSAAALRALRITLCRDRQVITSWTSRQEAASTTVMIRVADAGDFGVCKPRQFSGDMARPAMPTLFDPQGTMDRSFGCSRSFGGSTGTGTSLKTTMSAEALLEHYGRQLQDSGWVPASKTPSIVGSTWTRPDSTGATMQVSLRVALSPEDSTCRTVSLEVQTLRKP
ncbi:MAG TPA: hypothetical protein VIF32_12810 [Gemmatimonadaceae bacterium]|jgi:hypothetical protein